MKTRHALSLFYITVSSNALNIFTMSVKGTQNSDANLYFTLFIIVISLIRIDQMMNIDLRT